MRPDYVVIVFPERARIVRSNGRRWSNRRRNSPGRRSRTEPASTQSAKPAVHKTASAPKSEKRRSHKHYWTEGRIISGLHRHGIYW